MSKDYCTGFFETWVRWETPYSWSVFPLSELCKEHDKECSTHTFFKLLIKHRIVGGLLIGSVATIACWIKNPIEQSKRL